MSFSSSGCDCWLVLAGADWGWGLSDHFIMERLMRPGLTPRAQGAPDTPLMERLQHLPANTIRSCVSKEARKGALGGKWWWWWVLLQGELRDPLCPEAVWKGHCPWGAPTGPCCRASAGRVVFVQTGSGRLRGTCPPNLCLLFARESRSGSFCFFMFWSLSGPLWKHAVPVILGYTLDISQIYQANSQGLWDICGSVGASLMRGGSWGYERQSGRGGWQGVGQQTGGATCLFTPALAFVQS